MPAVAVRGEFCTSSPGLLKWLTIIIASVVLALILWDYHSPANLDPSAEQYTVFVAAFTIAVCFVLLLVFCLDIHRTLFAGCHCHVLVGWIFFLLMLLWLAAGGVQTWITVENRGKSSRYVGMRAASAALSFLNALLFAAAMQQSRVVVLYTDI